jgi:hypothetical protein
VACAELYRGVDPNYVRAKAISAVSAIGLQRRMPGIANDAMMVQLRERYVPFCGPVLGLGAEGNCTVAGLVVRQVAQALVVFSDRNYATL